MRFRPKHLIGALVLGAGLAFGGHAFSQDATKSEQAEVSPMYWTADGILVTPSIVNLSRDKDINIDSLITGGKVTGIYALDPVTVLNGKLNYLEQNGSEVKKYYTKEAKQREIRRLKDLLKQVESEKRTPEYSKSLENFSKDVNVNNRTIKSEELKDISEGTYCLDKRGIDAKVGNYDAPMLIHFGPNQKSTENNLENKVKVVQQEKAKKPENGNPELIFGLDVNALFNSYNADIGLRFHPFKNKAIGLGVISSLGFSLDQQVSSADVQYFDPILNSNVSMQGNKVKTNSFYLGLGSEVSYNFGGFTLFAGEEIEHLSDIEKSTESISLNGQVVNSNISSIPYSVIAGKTYIGSEFKISDNLHLGALIGYDTVKGLGIGARISLQLGK